jgi:hypothetical protein
MYCFLYTVKERGRVSTLFYCSDRDSNYMFRPKNVAALTIDSIKAVHCRSYFRRYAFYRYNGNATPWGEYTLVTLPCILTPYRDSVDGTRDRVTYQKLVTR